MTIQRKLKKLVIVCLKNIIHQRGNAKYIDDFTSGNMPKKICSETNQNVCTLEYTRVGYQLSSGKKFNLS